MTKIRQKLLGLKNTQRINFDQKIVPNLNKAQCYIVTWSATLDKFVKVVALFYKIKLKGYFSLQYNSCVLL